MFRVILITAALVLSPLASVDAKSDNAKDKGNKPAAAQQGSSNSGGGGNSGGGSGGGSTVETVTTGIAKGVIEGILSDQDKTVIREYFVQHPTKATSLPPGIAKNVARGKPIPPGIAKRGVPSDLKSRINLRDGYDLEQVGTDVILIEAGTRVVLDVLRDVLKR